MPFRHDDTTPAFGAAGAAGATGGPHHADVFSHLPARLMRELATPEVAQLLAALVAAGWRPGQAPASGRRRAVAGRRGAR